MAGMNVRQAPIDYIERTRAQYDALGFPPYAWIDQKDEPPPFASLSKPLSEMRVALIASGGIYQYGQIAFHHRDDTSFRLIDTTKPSETLRTSHFAYDMTAARQNINAVFPVDTLQTLVARSEVGQLARRAYTFMGGIYSARKVRDSLAPALGDALHDDEVDLAILVPA